MLGRIRQQHDEPVDADAEPGGGRHAVLERADVVGIEVHRLDVAGRAAPDLLAEALGLVLRVVQLREPVRELAPVDEELEAIGHERIRVAPPRERRHFGRIRMDEGRLQQAALAGLLEDRELERAGAVVLGRLDAERRAGLAEVATRRAGARDRDRDSPR